MSYWYYDWSSDSTATTSTGSSTDATAATTMSCNWCYIPVTRIYYITGVDHWTQEQHIAFARLINYETRTGFKHEAIITGELCITDPNAIVKPMAEFKIQLWVAAESVEDKEKIYAFFEANPATAPEENSKD